MEEQSLWRIHGEMTHLLGELQRAWALNEHSPARRVHRRERDLRSSATAHLEEIERHLGTLHLLLRDLTEHEMLARQRTTTE